nr:hypothetical protein [Nitrosomonas nitrosa]
MESLDSYLEGLDQLKELGEQTAEVAKRPLDSAKEFTTLISGLGFGTTQAVSLYQRVFGTAKGAVEKFTDRAGQAAEDAEDGATDLLSQARNAAGTLISQARNAASNVAESAQEQVGNAAAEARSAVQGLAPEERSFENAEDEEGYTAEDRAAAEEMMARGEIDEEFPDEEEEGALMQESSNTIRSQVGTDAAEEGLAPDQSIAANSVVDGATDVVSGATDAVSGATDAVTSAVGAATSAVGDAVGAATGAVSGAVNAATTAGTAAGLVATEGVGAALDATGVLAPIGLIVGIGGALASLGEEIGSLFESHKPHTILASAFEPSPVQ